MDIASILLLLQAVPGIIAAGQSVIASIQAASAVPTPASAAQLAALQSAYAAAISVGAQFDADQAAAAAGKPPTA